MPCAKRGSDSDHTLLLQTHHRHVPSHYLCVCFCFVDDPERNKNLENLDRVLDDKAIQELIGDDGEDEAKAKKAEETRKKKAKVEARLAQEKKAANRKNAGKKGKKGKDEDDMDDDDAMATFAKVANKKKKN